MDAAPDVESPEDGWLHLLGHALSAASESPGPMSAASGSPGPGPIIDSSSPTTTVPGAHAQRHISPHLSLDCEPKLARAPSFCATDGVSHSAPLVQHISAASAPTSPSPADAMLSVWNELCKLTDGTGRRLAAAFVQLPSRKVYPDYFAVIKNPICLDGIKRNVVAGRYRQFQAFEIDMLCMFANAREYNMQRSQIYQVSQLDLHVSAWRAMHTTWK